MKYKFKTMLTRKIHYVTKFQSALARRCVVVYTELGSVGWVMRGKETGMPPKTIPFNWCPSVAVPVCLCAHAEG